MVREKGVSFFPYIPFLEGLFFPFMGSQNELVSGGRGVGEWGGG